jgi:hypothetical protein
MEVVAMIACEADDEDILTQRLVGKFWAAATRKRFVSLFRDIAVNFNPVGLASLLEICRDPELGPVVRTITVIVDLKRRRPAAFHNLFDQALAALGDHGQLVRLGIRWVPNHVGEHVQPQQAACRMVGILQKNILPAARAAGLDHNDLLFELPDPSTFTDANVYKKLVHWISVAWIRHSTFGEPFNPNITIRFDVPGPGYLGNPSLTFTRNPDKVVCHDLLLPHMEPFLSLVQSTSQHEIHLVNCNIPDYFLRYNPGQLRTLTMENVSIFGENSDDHDNLGYASGCAGNLLRGLMIRCPHLHRLRLENIFEGYGSWLLDGPHTFDVTGPMQIARALIHLLEGYRGWEIDYMLADDMVVKTEMLRFWQGQGMGSGRLEAPFRFMRRI